MAKSLPILIIVPHGGYRVPDELKGYERVNRFDLFYSADSCANDLFAFGDRGATVISTDISRLFVDVDRPHTLLPPGSDDGVIKRETPAGKPVFDEGAFPDEIAIANLIRRYHLPFHTQVEAATQSVGHALIIDCHVMMPVGPKSAADAGRPRPLVTIENAAHGRSGRYTTCPDELAGALKQALEKFFESEPASVAGRIAINTPSFNGHILNRYGNAGIPMLRLSVSRSLFFTERYFNETTMRVDAARISALRDRLWGGIERFFGRYF
ncbi:MAG TPA: N-formylglutamate amidohydrolase [Spirochaetota bacterium]|nr:N-formylglutamate amidohydrolase [Spirochaetota bacterium]